MNRRILTCAFCLLSTLLSTDARGQQRSVDSPDISVSDLRFVPAYRDALPFPASADEGTSAVWVATEPELTASAREIKPWMHGALKGAVIGGLITGTAVLAHTMLTSEQDSDGWELLTYPMIFGYSAVPGALLGAFIGGVKARSPSH